MYMLTEASQNDQSENLLCYVSYLVKQTPEFHWVAA